MTQDTTIAFIVGPERTIEFYNAWASMLALDPPIEKVLIVFNPYIAKDHELFFDIGDMRAADMLKLHSFHSLAWCWNQCLLLSDTRYNLICNDDIVFRDQDCLEKIEAKHKEGYKIVHATENWSATSVDKSIINTVGWFDEGFWHSWEDIDYRFRMAHASERMFRFEPWLIRHLRCQKGRNEDHWNASAKHFFDKWGITARVQKLLPNWKETPESRKQLLCNQYFDHGIENELKQVKRTPDYYPKVSQEYREQYPIETVCGENSK